MRYNLCGQDARTTRVLSLIIVSHLPFAHDSPNAALPVGMMVTLDAEQGILYFFP
ncbi:hypothetical protein [Dolichospermum flos-aquae]|uniref:hypothetical protein n=1 Tax=Dolichospermum flosaquae TaxID=1166 RepID=UPI003908239C